MEINIQNVNMTYPNGKIALKDLNLDLKAQASSACLVRMEPGNPP